MGLRIVYRHCKRAARLPEACGPADNAGMAETRAGERFIRLHRSPARDGIGVFSVRAAGRTTYYTLYEMPCEIGGRGFAVHRLGVGIGVLRPKRLRPADQSRRGERQGGCEQRGAPGQHKCGFVESIPSGSTRCSHRRSTGSKLASGG